MTAPLPPNGDERFTFLLQGVFLAGVTVVILASAVSSIIVNAR